MESRSRRAARPLDCSLTLCRSTRHEGVFEDWERAKQHPEEAALLLLTGELRADKHIILSNNIARSAIELHSSRLIP